MSMGRVYVAPSANNVNGIAVLNESSTASGGTGVPGHWLTWNENGFSGTGWHFGEHGNPLGSWWTIYHTGNNDYVDSSYANTEEGFSDWVAAENPSNLDNALAGWDEGDKGDFVGYNYAALDTNGCLS